MLRKVLTQSASYTNQARLNVTITGKQQCSNYWGTGGFPPLRLSVPATVRVPGILEEGGGAVFVLGTAGGTRITDKYSSTSTSHVTRLMIINLSASILIIALVLLINITFINRR